MKVLDLRCANGHGFEGWFASDDDYMGQNGRGLIECPLCGDKVISRMPSAPRLNISGARAPQAPAGDTVAQAPADLQALWLHVARHVMLHTEDVGDRFADEARRIHYGEVAARGIRGQATSDERQALLEEGIEVMPLAIPKLLSGPMQ